MIPRTLLSFSAVYAALQFCLFTISHVFDLNLSSGAQVGILVAAAYFAMTLFVATKGRAPTLTENWLLALATNTAALLISLVFLAVTLLVMDDTEAFVQYMAGIPLALLSGVLGAIFGMQVGLCLLVFGWLARRHLKRIQAAEKHP